MKYKVRIFLLLNFFSNYCCSYADKDQLPLIMHMPEIAQRQIAFIRVGNNPKFADGTTYGYNQSQNLEHQALIMDLNKYLKDHDRLYIYKSLNYDIYGEDGSYITTINGSPGNYMQFIWSQGDYSPVWDTLKNRLLTIETVDYKKSFVSCKSQLTNCNKEKSALSSSASKTNAAVKAKDKFWFDSTNHIAIPNINPQDLVSGKKSKAFIVPYQNNLSLDVKVYKQNSPSPLRVYQLISNGKKQPANNTELESFILNNLFEGCFIYLYFGPIQPVDVKNTVPVKTSAILWAAVYDSQGVLKGLYRLSKYGSVLFGSDLPLTNEFKISFSSTATGNHKELSIQYGQAVFISTSNSVKARNLLNKKRFGGFVNGSSASSQTKSAKKEASQGANLFG